MAWRCFKTHSYQRNPQGTMLSDSIPKVKVYLRPITSGRKQDELARRKVDERRTQHERAHGRPLPKFPASPALFMISNFLAVL